MEHVHHNSSWQKEQFLDLPAVKPSESLTDVRGVLTSEGVAREHKVIEAIASISERSMVEFIRGIVPLYEILTEPEISSRRIDLAFLPWRGAEPLRWVLEAVHEINRGPEKVLPDFVWLPLGTQYNVHDLNQEGFRGEMLVSGLKGESMNVDKKRQKKKAVAAVWNTVREVFDMGGEKKRIVVIDEVQTGSTFTDALGTLNDVIREADADFSKSVELVGIALVDTDMRNVRAKVPQYERLIAGNYDRDEKLQAVLQQSRTGNGRRSELPAKSDKQRTIECIQLTLPFKTIDVVALLPTILYQTPKQSDEIIGRNEKLNRYELVEPKQNEYAKNILQTIAKEIIRLGYSPTHQRILMPE